MTEQTLMRYRDPNAPRSPDDTDEIIPQEVDFEALNAAHKLGGPEAAEKLLPTGYMLVYTALVGATAVVDPTVEAVKEFYELPSSDLVDDDDP